MLHQRMRGLAAAALPGGRPSFIQSYSEYQSSNVTVHAVDFPVPTQANSTLIFNWFNRTPNPTRHVDSLTDDQGNTWSLAIRTEEGNYSAEMWECFNATAGVVTVTSTANNSMVGEMSLMEFTQSVRETDDTKIVSTTGHTTVEHADPGLSSAGAAFGVAWHAFRSGPSSKTDPVGWTRTTMAGSGNDRTVYHREEDVQFINEVAQVTNLGVSRQYQAAIAFYVSP